jgi:hypothetical protein
MDCAAAAASDHATLEITPRDNNAGKSLRIGEDSIAEATGIVYLGTRREIEKNEKTRRVGRTTELWPGYICARHFDKLAIRHPPSAIRHPRALYCIIDGAAVMNCLRSQSYIYTRCMENGISFY